MISSQIAYKHSVCMLLLYSHSTKLIDCLCARWYSQPCRSEASHDCIPEMEMMCGVPNLGFLSHKEAVPSKIFRSWYSPIPQSAQNSNQESATHTQSGLVMYLFSVCAAHPWFTVPCWLQWKVYDGMAWYCTMHILYYRDSWT